MKRIFEHIFIDGLNGMAQGFFVTFVLGVIFQQIGVNTAGQAGNFFFVVGKIAVSMMGAGIGVGVARKYDSSTLVSISAAIAGMTGAFAVKILNGAILQDGGIKLTGSGEPVGAFIAAFAAIEIGMLISGKTKFDLILTPVVSIGAGVAAGLFAGPWISRFMGWLGTLISWGTKQHPLVMGIIVAVLMGMIFTSPVSAAAVGISLNLSGLAAGAATIGCCCSMIGFAVASYRENGFGGLLVQGLGTSLFQMPNIMKKPVIWLPAIVSSAVLGPVGTMVLHMTNNSTGSGMGATGLVGPIMTWQVMTQTEDPIIVLVKITVIQIILPAVVTLAVSEFMRKKKWIKYGDMRLEL